MQERGRVYDKNQGETRIAPRSPSRLQVTPPRLALIWCCSAQSLSLPHRAMQPWKVGPGRCCNFLMPPGILCPYPPLHSVTHTCCWSSHMAEISLALSTFYILSSVVHKSVPPLSWVRGTPWPGSIQSFLGPSLAKVHLLTAQYPTPPPGIRGGKTRHA